MPETSVTDAVLMGQVAHGKRESLEKLVRRHASGLLTFIVGMIGDRHRGEELFQEVVLAVWTKRRQYLYPRPFKPWLYRIALNRCRQEFRRASPSAVHLAAEDVAVADDPSPAEAAVAVETASVVRTAVARLPDQQRSVVVLRIWNGLAYGRIAETLGIAESTVRAYMCHALDSMRKYLEPRLR